MTIGLKIASLRKRLGMSQTDLADKISVSKDVIYKWEKGKSLPQLPYLRGLANALHTTVEDLIEDYDNKNIKKKGEPNMNKALEALEKTALRDSSAPMPTVFIGRDTIVATFNDHFAAREHFDTLAEASGYTIDSTPDENYFILYDLESKEIVGIHDRGRYDAGPDVFFGPVGCIEVGHAFCTTIDANDLQEKVTEYVGLYEKEKKRAIEIADLGTPRKKPLLLLKHIADNSYMAISIEEGDKPMYVYDYKSYKPSFNVSEYSDSLESLEVFPGTEYCVIPPSDIFIEEMLLANMCAKFWKGKTAWDFSETMPDREPIELLSLSEEPDFESLKTIYCEGLMNSNHFHRNATDSEVYEKYKDSDLPEETYFSLIDNLTFNFARLESRLDRLETEINLKAPIPIIRHEIRLLQKSNQMLHFLPSLILADAKKGITYSNNYHMRNDPETKFGEVYNGPSVIEAPGRTLYIVDKKGKHVIIRSTMHFTPRSQG